MRGGFLNSFSPDVETTVDVRPTNSIREQGSLTTLDEDVVGIVENSDSYTVSLDDELGEYDRDIPKDWVSSVDLEKDTISFYPPSDSVNVFDVDVKSYSIEDEDSDGLAEKVKIQFTCKPNDLTRVLDEDRLSDFRNNYYLNDREISDSEFEELKKEITEIPIKKIDKGSFEKTQTRLITPPTKGGKDWIDRGESNKITFTATLDKDSPSHRKARFETGSFSQEWIVITENNWYSNASDSEIDVRTTVDSGSLKLSGENAVGWWSMDSGSNSDGTTDIIDLTSSNNTGTHHNFDGDEWITGVFDGGLSFDGSDDVVTLPDGIFDFINSGTSISVSTWIRTTDSSSTDVHFFDTEGDASFWLMYNDDGNQKIEVRIFTVNSNTKRTRSSTSVDDGSWHHVVGIWDSTIGEIRIYVDGNLEDTTSTGQPNSNSNTNSIGARNISGERAVNGDVDELYAFSRVLSENEIKRIYNRTSPTSMTGSDLESGTWKSQVWNSNESNEQKIDSFETNCTIESGEEAYVRIGVDEDDDGTIDSWNRSTLDSCESGWTYNGDPEDDFKNGTQGATDEYVEGDGSLKLKTTDAALYIGYKEFSKSLDLTNVEELKLWVKGDGGTGSSEIVDKIIIGGDVVWTKANDTAYEVEPEINVSEYSGSTTIKLRQANNILGEKGTVWFDFIRDGNFKQLSNGSNTFTDSDFDIPSGYRYQVEYLLKNTDGNTTHSATVNDFELNTVEGTGFPDVSIDKVETEREFIKIGLGE